MIPEAVSWNGVPVFVPFTRLADATESYLQQCQTLEPDPIDALLVDVSGSPDSYVSYLSERWRARRSFVNMEHDIVPWPGALSSLWRCDYPWCGYGYLPQTDMNGGMTLGLVKYGWQLIEALPDVWKDMRRRWVTDPHRWKYCDIWMNDYAHRRGIRCHQHFPSVFNSQGNSSHTAAARPLPRIWAPE